MALAAMLACLLFLLAATSAPARQAPGEDQAEVVPTAAEGAPPLQTQESEQATQVPGAVAAQQAEAPTPTEDPGVWTYESDTMQVTVTRHEQGKFVYFAADIQLTQPSQFSYAFSNERYGAGTEALSDIAARHSPVLAINGDYYGFHSNGIVIRGGELYRKENSTRHLLIVEQTGDLTVMTDRSQAQGTVAERLLSEGVLHTFEFGPVLVNNGIAAPLSSTIIKTGNGYLEPRTAIGQLGPLHYLVIVVDGRSEGYSAGCDLPTLQQLFLDHGAQMAFNLDGGGSTTLWFGGEVINRPAAGGARKVSDIIMFIDGAYTAESR